MEIVSQGGEITRVKADAIVNPANSLGEMRAGLSAVLLQAAGPEVESEAMSKAPIPIGEAVATSAGHLGFRYIIHAPTVEKPSQVPTVENVRKATLAALMCADSFGVKTLAVPGIGTGAGGISPGSAAEIMVETLRHYETASVRKVILIDADPAMLDAFHEALLAERA